MVSKVYVGNLSWDTTDDGLATAFTPFATQGGLLDYIVMKDRETGRSRGFGFVTYATQEEADAAISTLNETQLDGRTIRVNMANSRPRQDYGSSLGPSYGGYGGGYGSPYAAAPAAPGQAGVPGLPAQGFAAFPPTAQNYADFSAYQGQFQPYGSPQGAFAQPGAYPPAFPQGYPTNPAAQGGFPGQYGYVLRGISLEPRASSLESGC